VASEADKLSHQLMMVTANHMCKDKTIPSNNYCKAFLNLLTKFANFEIHPNAF